MASESISASISDDPCCSNVCDPCEDWLNFSHCNAVPITLKSCGVTTEFHYARQRSVKMTATNPMSGLHAADKIFEFSTIEHDDPVEIMPGGIITVGDDPTKWTIYAIEDIPTFCVKRTWARSVVRCFNLLGDIDIMEQDCQCEDSCDTAAKFLRAARIKGNILATTATAQTKNDGTSLVYRFTAELSEWPLAARPGQQHRLKHKGDVYRITRIDDRGGLMPFMVDLEVDTASCC